MHWPGSSAGRAGRQLLKLHAPAVLLLAPSAWHLRLRKANLAGPAPPLGSREVLLALADVMRLC